MYCVLVITWFIFFWIFQNQNTQIYGNFGPFAQSHFSNMLYDNITFLYYNYFGQQVAFFMTLQNGNKS